MEITLRKARKDDCKDILYWRNDLKTRKASFNSQLISFKNHQAWFEKSLVDSDRYMYIARDKRGKKIGLLRIDRLNKRVAEININVSPFNRGKGLGGQLLRKGIQKFIRDNRRAIFIARVKPKNIVSVKVFKKCGFQEILTYMDKRSGCKIMLLMNCYA